MEVRIVGAPSAGNDNVRLTASRGSQIVAGCRRNGNSALCTATSRGCPGDVRHVGFVVCQRPVCFLIKPSKSPSVLGGSLVGLERSETARPMIQHRLSLVSERRVVTTAALLQWHGERPREQTQPIQDRTD